ncbi:zinc-binding alcohol dehydrogenase family protein [Cohnella sp. WQ 127256]|uniref:zinc-binding alcohol dehydrogenase family protein n=1 Tax=Cohnella sp. WQ 127256 TaxID=2938790 RepID=UPI00211867A2|nr:zinc-binding alcohol dehydrogenase family protein [Cohnella sp. WQ 127256]
MRSLVCRKPDLFEMQQIAIPTPKEGEALIKVLAVGVCGTDYHAFRGNQPYFAYPRVLGHEIAGEIAEVSSGKSGGLRAGDRVTVMPYIACQTCIACRQGKSNACSQLKVLGVHADGSMCEYMTVPTEYIVKAEGMSVNQIAIIEPLSIGLHAVNRARIESDEVVLVVGAGPIGLAVMKFAKLAGAQVIAMDMNKERLSFAEKWAQVDAIVDALGDVDEALKTITKGDYPTTVIDATGNAHSMMNTFSYAAHGGKVVFVSLVQADITFSDPEFHKKELTLLGSRAANLQEFEHVIACMKAGHIDADSFISHRAPFDQTIDSFNTWLKRESGVIKALIEM